MGKTGGEKVYMDVKVVGYKGVKRERWRSGMAKGIRLHWTDN
jgi:hypothetical protein